MDPVNIFVWFVTVASALAIFATCLQARAAPRFVLAQGGFKDLGKKLDSFGQKLNCHGNDGNIFFDTCKNKEAFPQPIYCPPGNGRSIPRHCPPRVSADMDIMRCGKFASDEDCDDPTIEVTFDAGCLAGPQLAKIKKPHRAHRRLYTELVQAFSDSGTREMALMLKAAISKRLPGHRRLVETAFEEACREVFYLS